ncbi:FKBP-type peptidyl-prolyl cis-trans isomerase [Roseateles sp. DAIF2]|nr:FKBP-type peptidyl-prolyl cis-trans isomerase [Roseateles sp. DAIF2]
MSLAKTSRRHLLALSAATVTLLGLSACGGGGGGNDNTPGWGEVSGSTAITTLKTTDTLLGAGAEAQNGKKLTVHYTGWLYDVRVTANQKGTQFETSTNGSPIAFTLGAGTLIKGWEQGLVGMKVGGKRTLLIPASLAYGSAGQRDIPGNAALIFEIQLIGAE